MSFMIGIRMRSLMLLVVGCLIGILRIIREGINISQNAKVNRYWGSFELVL